MSRSARRRFAVESLEDRALLSAGDLDYSYANNGRTTAQTVLADEDRTDDVAVDSQGRAVIVGSSENSSGNAENDFSVTRFLADGTYLDFEHVDFGLTNKDDAAHAVAILSSGKILVVGDAGDEIGICRLNDDNTLDTTFDGDGKMTFGVGSGRAVAVQSDGKILIAGSGPGAFGKDDFVVIRLNADGTLDTTFNDLGTPGRAAINIFNQSTDQALGLALQSDGKIVVVGSSLQSGLKDWAVARLNADGTLDNSFSFDGVLSAKQGLETDTDYAQSAVVQADGKIVVAGRHFQSQTQSGAGVAQTYVIRYFSDGTVDTVWGQGGVTVIDKTGNSNHYLELGSDGKFLLVGSSGGLYGFVATRLLADGDFDPTFGVGGRQTYGNDPTRSYYVAGAYTYDGGLYIAGSYWSLDYKIIVAVQLDAVAVSPDAIVGRSGGTWWAAQGTTSNSLVNKQLTTWPSNVNFINVFTADVNGDGYDDLVGRDAATGQWQASINNQNGTFAALKNWGTWLASATFVDVHPGDVNGDGRADMVGRVDGTEYWYVAISNGLAFSIQAWMQWSTTANWVDVFVTDMNADGRSDVVGRNSLTGQWNVGLSNGTTFTNSVWRTWSTTVTWVDVRAGDVNGDGRSDIAGRVQSTGQWYVAVSTGTSLGSAAVWTTWSAAVNWQNVQLIDMTGDGKADLVGRSGNDWWVGTSNGVSSFANLKWGSWPAAAYVDIVFGDFNGDSRIDVAGRTNGQWWVLRNTGALFAAASQWGVWSNTVTWKDVQVGRRIA